MLNNQPCNNHISEDHNTDLHWSEASKEYPCPICQKTDWCYLGFKGSSVEFAFCGRDEATPPHDWVEYGTSNDDRIKYRRNSIPEKKARPEQEREWIYTDIDGNPIAKSVRWDYPDQPKKIRRQYMVDGEWVWKLPNGLDKKAFKTQIAPLYWDEVDKAISNGEEVIICEGETTADTWRKLGFTATTFISAKWANQYKDYFIGAKVVFSPDADTQGIKLMEKVYQALKGIISNAQWFYVYPHKVKLWENLPENNGVDMKDFSDDEDLNPELVRALFESDRRHFDKVFKMLSATKSSMKETKKAKESDDSFSANLGKIQEKISKNEAYMEELTENETTPVKLNPLKLLVYIKDKIDLKFNILTKQIEVDGEVLELDPQIYLLEEHGINTTQQLSTDLFKYVAKQNQYNPVHNYLEEVSSKTKPINISNISSRYFGTSNPLYDLFVEKMLIGAVARVYDPGCKLDNSLVLQGEQGLGKSSVFDVLGGDFYDDSMGKGSVKDDLLTLHSSWIQEWGEIDRIFGKKALGEVKDFLSKRKDVFREPYARKPEIFKRRSVIVGTVNDSSFLNDPTGNRRFWVVPVAKEIDIEKLKKERDGIWAGAVQAYKEGKTWWLSREEEKLSEENNEQFQIKDEWQSIIEDYLSDKSETTVADLLQEALGFQNKKDMDKASQMRVTNALSSMGWKKKRKSRNGIRQMIWERPNPIQPEGAENAETLSNRELATPATPNSESIDHSVQSEETNNLTEQKDKSQENETLDDNGMSGVSIPHNKEIPDKHHPNQADQKRDNDSNSKSESHRWVPLEAKPYGTENDLPQDMIENLVMEQLVKNGEMEEYHIIVAVGQKSPSVRQALDQVAVSRTGRYNDVPTKFWKLKS